MRLIILLCFALSLFGDATFAKEVGYETNYAQAIEKAKKEKKGVMLFMTTNFCPWCKKMEKLTLKKEKINATIHEKYVPLIINRDVNKYPEKFYSTVTPVIYFIDAKTESITHKLIGYRSTKDFKKVLK